jgi:hypothetical protein
MRRSHKAMAGFPSMPFFSFLAPHPSQALDA